MRGRPSARAAHRRDRGRRPAADARAAPGDALEIPAGDAAHPAPDRRRATGRPRSRCARGRSEEFLERLAELSRDGRLLRGGWPRPTAAAELVRDFGDEGHAAKPPGGRARGARYSPAPAPGRRARRARPATSTCSSTSGTSPPRRRRCSTRSPTRAPTRGGGRPVYIDVEADGPPKLGKVSRQHFKGRLPYHLHTGRGSRASSRRTSSRATSPATCGAAARGR